MPDACDDLLDNWVHNFRRALATERDALVDDLLSDDAVTRQDARNEIEEILDWLEPPLKLSPADDEQTAVEVALLQAGVPAARARSIALKAAPSINRKSGRPRTNGPYAIRAFTEHMKTAKTWREITLKLKGPCEHRCSTCRDADRPQAVESSGLRPRRQRARCLKCGLTIRPEKQKQQVCKRCGDATRDAVGQLAELLRAKGWYPAFPRLVEVEKMSPAQIDLL